MGAFAGQVAWTGNAPVQNFGHEIGRAFSGCLVQGGISVRIGAIGADTCFASAVGSEHPPDAARAGLYEDQSQGLLVVAEGVLFSSMGRATQLGIAETLASLYREHGQDFPSSVDGEYAFVIWDRGRKRVMAGTDTAGMRSLYYLQRPGAAFAFASDPYVLAEMQGLDSRVDERRLVEQLVLPLEIRENWDPLVCGVRRLAAGHVLLAARDTVEERRYWAVGQASPPGLRESDINGWVEGVRWYFDQAVRKRLAGSVRPGILLSGGLDSSAIAAFASSMRPGVPLDCYSLIDSALPGCAETDAIGKMASAFPLSMHTIDIASCTEEASESLSMISASPRFLSGRGAFLHLSLARAARVGVDAVFDGIDADALFAHGSAREWVSRGLWHELASNRRKMEHLRPDGAGAQLHPLRGLAAITLGSVLQPMLKPLRSGLSHRMYRDMSLLNSDAIRRFGINESLRDYQAKMDAHLRARGRRQQRSAMDSPIIEDGLRRMGARAAEHGLRMSHPFMDRALIEFCAWLPPQLMLKNGRTKWVMRKAANPFLPHSVCWRADKQHIGARFDRLVLQPVLDRMTRDLARGRAAVQGYIDVARVEALVAGWRAGSISATSSLTELLLLENWLRHNPSRVRWGN